MIRKQVIISLLCLSMSGCAANYFRVFYTDEIGGADVRTLDNVIVTDSEPNIYVGKNLGEETLLMKQRGYLLIGHSSYKATSGSLNQVRDLAKEVHADTAIFYAKRFRTQTDVWAIPKFDTQTSTTNVYGTVYGSGGSATVIGTGTTTTTSTGTDYIPITTTTFDFAATFWVKSKPMALGAYFQDLSQEQRKRIGSNKGAVISIIVDKSPAFYADVLSGDIIKSINGIEIIDANSVLDIIGRNAGQTVSIEIVRGDERLNKVVDLN